MSDGRRHASRRAADCLKELVARPVPERVVDRLEVVDVEEEDADRVPASRGAADCEREAVEEEGAVGHAGERVVEGLVRDVVERPGVVEGKARVLGEGEKRLLVARGVGAVWIVGCGHDAADDRRALEDGGRHAGMESRRGARGPESDGRADPCALSTTTRRPSCIARAPRPGSCDAAARAEELGAQANRRDNGRPLASVRVAHAHHPRAVADELAGGSDDLVEDLVERLLGDDRALDRREALEHHLTIAKRLE